MRLALASLALLLAQESFACSCGGDPGEFRKTPRDIAKYRFESANAVFEGTPIRFERKWSVFDLPDGAALPPASSEYFGDANYPHMKVTFRVTRAYKGVTGGEVSLLTNLGGGDCGARFATGIDYLIYLPSSDFVIMCSPMEWIGSGREDAQLRYLRHEKSFSEDLKVPDRREASRADYERRYNAATGVICGRIEGRSEGTVRILSTAGYSSVELMGQPNDLKPDGSFCSERQGPGRYYVLFQPRDPALATYYPGVGTQQQATPVEIAAGQTRTNVVFKPVPHETYSLRGIIWARKGSLDNAKIILENIDTGEQVGGEVNRTLHYLPFYYRVDNLSPGHYIVWAGDQRYSGPENWVSDVAKLDLTARSQFKILTLTRK